MCLAIPGEILKITDGVAVVEIEGNRVNADISLLPEAVEGDYVIVHAGFAISKYSREEAEETLALFREISGESG